LGVSREDGASSEGAEFASDSQDEARLSSLEALAESPQVPLYAVHTRTVRRPRVRTAALRVRPVEQGLVEFNGSINLSH